MGKKMYEVGYLIPASPAEYDFETVDYEDDYDSRKEATKVAKELSKRCPFVHYGQQIEAISVTCHSDEEGITSYWIHWKEIFVNGKMVWHLDF